jgi:putative ABC transport system permease protein
VSRQGNLRLAWRSLRYARARSFLTMLGIIIGVMAVTLVACVGQGIKEQIAGQLGRFGKQTISVQPITAGNAAGAFTGLAGASTSLLSENDLAIVRKAAGVETAVPLSATSGTVHADHTIPAPFVVATTVDFASVVSQSIEYGGFFDPDPDSHTVVLGSDVAHRLFDDNAPLGQTLIWRGQHFVVAGVFKSFSAPPFSLEANFNNAVFVPYPVAQQLSGSVLGMYQIIARVSKGVNMTQVAQQVHAELVAAHGGANDVSVLRSDQNDVGSNQTIHLLTVLVTGAALVALVVGGVGIMDVMLVSVTERMHEIGLRKAIGATNRQIMRQFMAEAFVLSAGGAAIGVVLACAAVGLLRLYTSLQPVLVWQVLVAAPLVAVAIGLFFGSMPALKAARKDPIEALRQA